MTFPVSVSGPVTAWVSWASSSSRWSLPAHPRPGPLQVRDPGLQMLAKRVRR